MQSTSMVNVGKTRYQEGHKPLHRTFSAETAMKETSEFLQNTHKKIKIQTFGLKYFLHVNQLEISCLDPLFLFCSQRFFKII
jgi:hypothetical protein